MEKFVSTAIDRAVTENHKSLAFPAVGCGGYGCTSSVVAEAMVQTAYKHGMNKGISISFVIQSGKKDVYEEFQKQVAGLNGKASPIVPTLDAISVTIGKGTIDVSIGNLVTERV